MTCTSNVQCELLRMDTTLYEIDKIATVPVWFVMLVFAFDGSMFLPETHPNAFIAVACPCLAGSCTFGHRK